MGIKGLVESGYLNSIPPEYVFPSNLNDLEVEEVPTVDFSQLTAGTPDERSKAIQVIGKACREWGFFMVINHSMPRRLMDEMLNVGERFFDLAKEEKQDHAGKELFDPIRCGTGFNNGLGNVFLWRDYLKVHVHPHFHAPHKPADFRETSEEYCKKARDVAEELLKGISKSLGQEENYIHKKMDIESGSQLLVMNLYPPCPRPELVMGMPPHSDHGILTLLMQNDVCGLQILHNGKWVPVNPPPYSFLVNTGDHMEILTNGRYESVVHQVVVNSNATRMTIATGHGPPLGAIISPAAELVDSENHPPKYQGMKYRDYIELQQTNQLEGKSCLDRVRI